MKANIRMKVLMIYNLFLAAGAFWLGVEMVRSSNGIFTEYPHIWAARLPFHNWVLPGILAIIVFGIRNVIAAILCTQNKRKISWAASAIMGGIFFCQPYFSSHPSGRMVPSHSGILRIERDSIGLERICLFRVPKKSLMYRQIGVFI